MRIVLSKRAGEGPSSTERGLPPSPTLEQKIEAHAGPTAFPSLISQSKKFAIKLISTVRSNIPVLKWYQDNAEKYLIERDKENLGGALFMKMRLGKTFVMCHYITQYKKQDINLVVCPYNVMHTWNDCIKSFGVKDVTIVDGSFQERIFRLSVDSRWYILNYEMAVKLDILSFHFNNLILDESIRVSNPKNNSTSYFLKMSRVVDRVFVLAGEPRPENDFQLIAQMLIMQPKVLNKSNFWSIRNAYFEEFGHNWFAKKNTATLLNKELHDNCYVLTKEQAGLIDDKVKLVRKSKMTAPQRAAYNEMLEKFEYNGVVTDFHISQYIFLQKIAGGYDISKGEFFSHEKIYDMIYLMKSEFKGEPVLIWCRFEHEVEYIVKMLTSSGFNVGMIYGDVKKEVRETIRGMFNVGRLDAVVATIKSISRGNDWSGGDTTFYYSNEYSFDEKSQSEERTYNINKQDKKRTMIEFVSENSIDEDIIEVLAEKKSNSKFIMSELMYRLQSKKVPF